MEKRRNLKNGWGIKNKSLIIPEVFVVMKDDKGNKKEVSMENVIGSKRKEKEDKKE